MYTYYALRVRNDWYNDFKLERQLEIRNADDML